MLHSSTAFRVYRLAEGSEVGWAKQKAQDNLVRGSWKQVTVSPRHSACRVQGECGIQVLYIRHANKPRSSRIMIPIQLIMIIELFFFFNTLLKSALLLYSVVKASLMLCFPVSIILHEPVAMPCLPYCTNFQRCRDDISRPPTLVFHPSPAPFPREGIPPLSPGLLSIKHNLSINSFLYYPNVRICSKCLMTVMLASIKRSTQLRMQGSSLRSRAPDVIFDVMHFLKHF